MSALPASVQAQVDKANELVGQLNMPVGETDPETLETSETPEPKNPPVEETPPVVQSVEGGDPESPPAKQPPAETPDWQHKYNVLQGKYNAEVPRLNRRVQEQDQELGDMRQRLTNTETLLASLNRGKAATETDEAPTTPPRRLVKDEEIEAFGSDLYDFIQRTADERLGVKVGDVTSRVEQRVAKAEEAVAGVTRVMARSEEDKVLQMLDQKVPDWRVQNEDENFLRWLNEVDPYAGAQRGELLSQAFQSHDGPRVVAFFNGFRNENAAVTPQSPAPTPAQTPAQSEGQSLDGLVAPGTPKAGPQAGAPNEGGKRVWTRPQIVGLYAKINEYTKKGKPAPKELQAEERDLMVAQREGRIQA